MHPATNVRAGGAWHHLAPAGGPREEIAAAAELLDEHVPRVGVRELALFDRLRDEVARTDDCDDLPHAFVHPDFVPANAISTAVGKLAIVDWTGAGRGPRLWSIGFLLWAAGARDLQLVEVVVSRYRRSIELEPAELDRLEGAILGRPVTLEAWSVCAGRREITVCGGPDPGCSPTRRVDRHPRTTLIHLPDRRLTVTQPRAGAIRADGTS